MAGNDSSQLRTTRRDRPAAKKSYSAGKARQVGHVLHAGADEATRKSIRRNIRRDAQKARSPGARQRRKAFKRAAKGK